MVYISLGWVEEQRQEEERLEFQSTGGPDKTIYRWASDDPEFHLPVLAGSPPSGILEFLYRPPFVTGIVVDGSTDSR